MIRFFPGLTGAAAAYVALIFIHWINSGLVRAVLFLVVYLVVAIIVDKAMAGYRKPDSKN
jgi:hypothetical protein